MSKKPNSSAAALRAALLDSTAFTGPRDGKDVRTLAERAAGGELKGYSVLEDLRAVVTPLLHLALSVRCHRAIERAYADPDIRRLERLERLLDAEAARKDLPPGVGRSLREASGALVYHRAELGCSTAQAVISARALAAAALFIETGEHLDRAMILMRHAIFRAEEAQYAEPEPQPGPIYSHVEGRSLNPGAWVHAWTTIGSALRMIEDEEAILRGGAGQQAEPPVVQDGDLALDFGLPDIPAGELSAEEILAVGRSRKSLDDAAARRAVRIALSRVVFPKMDHLPAPSKSVQDRGDSPRALAEPVAGKPLPLVPAPDPAAFLARLNAKYPWAADVNELYANDVVGAPYARIPPRILVAGVGLGKSAYARDLLEFLGLPVTVYQAAAQIDGAGWSGTGRMWGTWRPSVVAQAALRAMLASVGIAVDEIDKAGTSRRWGRLDEAILPFLDGNARKVFDPAFEIELDLSAVSYVLTANQASAIGGPLRDRCQLVEFPSPREQDLPVIAATILEEIRRERGTDATWLPDLTPDELDLIPWRGGSMRPLKRMVATVLQSRDRFTPRH
ncbi:P-loop NTPase family protein [Methylorubrum thiocyanatum]|uniref:hypothetical protein n=1 Tax=Methylorubrum thiocyanatum TaxID=47958 RepID=UPI00398C78BC